MDSSKSDNEILSPDKIKQEPGELSLTPGTSTLTNGGRVVTLVSNSVKTPTTSAQKTILLVQALSNKTGSIQSLLLPQNVRGLPSRDPSAKRTAAVSLSSLLPMSVRAGSGRVADCVLTPARTGGVKVMAMPSTLTQSAAIVAPSPSLGGSEAAALTSVELQTTYALTFNSRTIQADGTVCALKEYLCNFCQFKVADAHEMEKHFATHLFSCNYCSFRCTSRLDALCHKRDSHTAAADELSGYEDLEHPSLVAKISRFSRPGLLHSVPPPLLMPPAKSLVKSTASGFALNSTLMAGGSVVTTTSALKPSVATSLSSSVVMRSATGKPGDNYFTYRIIHDVDGKVQSYECDVCAYQSERINEMFAHASTHSLAELAKSSSGTEILWECFYCSFTALKQVAVVGHVIATHPNKPIQLKRVAAAPPSVESRTGQAPAVLPPPATPEAAKVNGQSVEKKADKAQGDADKKKKTESDDQCIWGCYYCSMTSASRNEIICHLKKDHPTEKLVVTRRRLARIQDDSSAAGTVAVAKNSAKQAENTDLPNTVENSPVDLAVSKSDGKSARKKQRLAADETADINQGADGESVDQQQGSAKSRRKQPIPKKVGDENVDKDAPSEGDGWTIEANGITSNDSKVVSETLAKQDVTVTSRKHGRSVSKYDGLIKKLKMADSEQESLASSLLQDKFVRSVVDNAMPDAHKTDSSVAKMPELQKNALGKLADVQKSSKSPVAGGRTKALSLLTGQLVTGYVKPPAKTTDLEMPTLLRENKLGMEFYKKTGLKDGVMKIVHVPHSSKRLEHLQNFVYDSTAMSARCGVCGSSIQGKHALEQMQEHVAVHYNDCKWSCAYCSFQCSQRMRIVMHVRRSHCDKPLRLLRRVLSNKASRSPLVSPVADRKEKFSGSEEAQQMRSKLRGPRCRREEKFVETADTVWQCPFCSRRSVFLGFVRIHIRLAHPDVDIDVLPQKWIVEHTSSSEVKPDIKRGFVSLVRNDDVANYERLNNIIMSNGEELIHDLDVDDDTETTRTSTADSDDMLEFRCMQCPFRGTNPAVVKCHVLHSHTDEDVTILDMRSSRRINHEHLFMCKSVECQFMTSISSEFDLHIERNPSHATNKLVNIQSIMESRIPKQAVSPETKLRARVGTKVTSFSPLSASVSPTRRSQHHEQFKSNAAKAVNGPEAVREMASRSPRTANGEIEYCDDGTIKGVELVDDGSGSACIQCLHCEYRSTSLVDMKGHLWHGHPRLEPLSIDVNAAIAGLHSWLFFCPVSGCYFVAGYYNIYKHHVDVEHPDLAVGSDSKARSRKRRSGGSSRRSSASNRDTSYTASISAVPERHSSRRPVAAVDVASEGTNDSSSTTSPGPARNETAPAVGTVVRVPSASKSTSYRPYQSTKDGSMFDFSRRYECVLCVHAVATLSDMKSHLLASHDTSVVHQCIDRRARQLRKRQKILFCPQATCSYCCKLEDDLARHVELEHPGTASVALVSAILASSSSSGSVSAKRSATAAESDDCLYQCSHCTFITTDMVNMRQHVTTEHAAGEAGGSCGFAAIKTAFGQDGNVVMNVNDAEVTSDDNSQENDCVDVDSDSRAFTVL